MILHSFTVLVYPSNVSHIQIEPTNDNELTVEWYHNGQPLANGHRFRKTHDFGYVALDILYVFPEDTGEWTCVARNRLGSLFFQKQKFLLQEKFDSFKHSKS